MDVGWRLLEVGLVHIKDTERVSKHTGRQALHQYWTPAVGSVKHWYGPWVMDIVDMDIVDMDILYIYCRNENICDIIFSFYSLSSPGCKYITIVII